MEGQGPSGEMGFTLNKHDRDPRWLGIKMSPQQEDLMRCVTMRARYDVMTLCHILRGVGQCSVRMIEPRVAPRRPWGETSPPLYLNYSGAIKASNGASSPAPELPASLLRSHWRCSALNAGCPRGVSTKLAKAIEV
ncbi:hypothetical protein SKAU_G00010690 [Synaphobranchus kaupii]|uniref:Uncharacterized protein n=1 Tax=Synaphobranchus kaupii TaxID=118154 RepID=A0A9Q1JB65_SYNKA|nr:hypothetical protein SKAU_G00010690 [Synaphobranchus kaupii]